MSASNTDTGDLAEIAGRSAGAEITDEAPNGVAALAGLHPGDVINAVDGKSVRTPMELAADLSGKAAGAKIRLGFLVMESGSPRPSNC